jgi:hypothetical protein
MAFGRVETVMRHVNWAQGLDVEAFYHVVGKEEKKKGEPKEDTCRG